MSARGPVQRLPLSPSSPISPTKDTAHLPPNRQSPPQSPLSPQLMSVSTKSYASSLAHTQPSPTETASQSGRPQSSPLAAFSPSQQPDAPSTNPFPTPADSAYGISNVAEPQTMEDKMRERHPLPQKPAHLKDRMDVDLPDTSSRQSEQLPTADIAPTSTAGDSRFASDEISLEQIQKDMGEAFLTCRTALHATRPNPAEHLLSRYGLGPLVATVARNDPTSGEKINKLRKSYEGQIKNLGLAGKNKAEKTDEKPLIQLLSWPEQEWHIQKEASKRIEFGDAFKSRVQQAMKMQPGSVRNQGHWDNVLGHEKPLRPPGLPEPKQDTAAASTSGAPNGVLSGQQRAQQPQNELNRPRRAGKKRSYNDNSFAGYGEGYIDDDGNMDVYSSDDQGRGGRKRRKKEHEA